MPVSSVSETHSPVSGLIFFGLKHQYLHLPSASNFLSAGHPTTQMPFLRTCPSGQSSNLPNSSNKLKQTPVGWRRVPSGHFGTQRATLRPASSCPSGHGFCSTHSFFHSTFPSGHDVGAQKPNGVCASPSEHCSQVPPIPSESTTHPCPSEHLGTQKPSTRSSPAVHFLTQTPRTRSYRAGQSLTQTPRTRSWPSRQTGTQTP